MYTQSITRTHRTAFIFVIDGSGSMAEKIRFRGRLMTKADAVASITNGMLFELIERARRSDGVRDYYDIAVLGYSGDDEVYSLLPGSREAISVTELAAGEPPLKTEIVEYRLPDGSNALREISTPAWVEPEAVGQTPMCEALRRVRDIAAGDTPRTVFFPSTEEADYPNRYAAVLYECSSLMPEVFDEAIREAKGPGATPPFRGMSYNASAEQLITMLNIGSISVKTE